MDPRVEIFSDDAGKQKALAPLGSWSGGGRLWFPPATCFPPHSPGQGALEGGPDADGCTCSPRGSLQAACPYLHPIYPGGPGFRGGPVYSSRGGGGGGGGGVTGDQQHQTIWALAPLCPPALNQHLHFTQVLATGSGPRTPCWGVKGAGLWCVGTGEPLRMMILR